MNIGNVAQALDMPAKTIRYYESIGLVTPKRSQNDYRHYRPSDVHKLGFVGRARSLGFSVEDCRVLLALYEDKDRASADVRKLAGEHLARIDAKLAELATMRETLAHLVECCAGDTRPDCPILADLAGAPDAV
ncbi:Cu(I)-responsive transcriptional regulator [Abyssibius alkaniclasticus]|uniref:Cu(I)-responsive transcriptional regulator n=1 Tax=Abyssibius alkaniclasticus TaxID=2881234 RepID=UPI004058DCC5|tara:strand:+ start:713 stop:1111 length:399 start_codon:yes stop_codon:yes gene_type:complete